MARRSSIWAVETAVSGSALSFKYHAEFCSKKRRCGMEHAALWGVNAGKFAGQHCFFVGQSTGNGCCNVIEKGLSLSRF